jgi:hypothetical protein
MAVTSSVSPVMDALTLERRTGALSHSHVIKGSSTRR